jgi:predicted SnoaL-like aldol condensation-catalyzing enzyme
MKFAKTILAAALVAATPFAAQAQMRALSDPVVPHPDPESLFTSDDPVLHRNKQAALHIQRNLLKCNEWDRAGEWLTDAYIQHNPVAASGLEGVIYYFTQVAQRPALDPCPALSAEDPNGVVAVQAEGDYVTILTRRIVPYVQGDMSDTYTTTWFDTWRFVDGKADEHWDPATLPGTPAPAPAAAAAASLSPEQVAQRVADDNALHELMWKYDRALDRFLPDEYAALFTEDGTFGETAGRDALREMIAGFANREEGPPRLQHASTNHWIEYTGPDSASIHYYWQTYRLGEGDTPTSLIAAGNGVDDVVRQDGKWLFQKRNVAPTVEEE